MGRVRRTLAMVGLLLCFTACDPGGQVYEDLRLAQLKVGGSTEADVRRIFGPPDTVRTGSGGKGLVYPLGPEGAHTLLIRIGADGTYQGREDLLTRANFGRVQKGQKGPDVLAILGRPGRTQTYAMKQETAWEWRFNDGAETRLFVVMFDASGQVVSTAIEEDPRRTGGS